MTRTAKTIEKSAARVRMGLTADHRLTVARIIAARPGVTHDEIKQAMTTPKRAMTTHYVKLLVIELDAIGYLDHPYNKHGLRLSAAGMIYALEATK